MNAKSQNKKNKSSNLADYERGGREWWEYIIAGSREQGAESGGGDRMGERGEEG